MQYFRLSWKDEFSKEMFRDFIHIDEAIQEFENRVEFGWEIVKLEDEFGNTILKTITLN